MQIVGSQQKAHLIEKFVEYLNDTMSKNDTNDQIIKDIELSLNELFLNESLEIEAEFYSDVASYASIRVIGEDIDHEYFVSPDNNSFSVRKNREYIEYKVF